MQRRRRVNSGEEGCATFASARLEQRAEPARAHKPKDRQSQSRSVQASPSGVREGEWAEEAGERARATGTSEIRQGARGKIHSRCRPHRKRPVCRRVPTQLRSACNRADSHARISTTCAGGVEVRLSQVAACPQSPRPPHTSELHRGSQDCQQQPTDRSHTRKQCPRSRCTEARPLHRSAPGRSLQPADPRHSLLQTPGRSARPGARSVACPACTWLTERPMLTAAPRLSQGGIFSNRAMCVQLARQRDSHPRAAHGALAA